MRIVVAMSALAGLVLSALVHVAALAGNDVQVRFPQVWMLHLGIFAVFIPLVIAARQRFGASPSRADIESTMPRPIVWLGKALMAYAFINFALFMYLMREGGPRQDGGKFVVSNHGRVVREITPAEYSALRAGELRGFSGHWLVFYFLPFGYFAFSRRAS
jgi:hypothetical protein